MQSEERPIFSAGSRPRSGRHALLASGSRAPPLAGVALGWCIGLRVDDFEVGFGQEEMTMGITVLAAPLPCAFPSARSRSKAGLPSSSRIA